MTEPTQPSEVSSFDTKINHQPATNPAVEHGVDFRDPSTVWNRDFVDHCQRHLGVALTKQLAIYALPDDFLLSVIVPVFNEESTVETIVARLLATGMPMQIILVDDGSTDNTSAAMQRVAQLPQVELHKHAVNRGKGAAIRTAISHCRGDVIVIQDADQEYNPQDFRVLLQPIIERHADVVYGTRYGQPGRQVSPWWHQAANYFITLTASIAFGLRIRDIETCYKMARAECFRSVADDLRENRFGIEIELTARWAKERYRFAERPIEYHHRWYNEGKKITWRDGIAALYCIVRYAFLKRKI